LERFLSRRVLKTTIEDRDMDVKAEAPLVGIPVPENPLSEVQLSGTQIKDDCNEFVELAG
jgi:hypothetical protein